MASDAWQSAMAARREEIVDPVLKMNLEERFRAVTTRSLERLMEKLDAPVVSDQVVASVQGSIIIPFLINELESV